MDSVLVSVVMNQVPGMVSSHPKAFLAIASAYMAIEHALPWLNKYGVVNGSSSIVAAINMAIGVIKKLKKG